MLEDCAPPRLFAQAPGVDFPKAVLHGLEARLATARPEEWARITLIVNTDRMRRRIRALFDEGPPRLLPRLLVLTELDRLLPDAPPAPALPALARLLDMLPLVEARARAEAAAQGSEAHRHAIMGLTMALAALMDEMAGEGVDFEALSSLDLSDHAEQWQRSRAFLDIARDYLRTLDDAPQAEARQRLIVDRLIAHWRHSPPAGPIILAGSTGSRGTTARLMEAVSRLPQGAVILPGFDFEMPAPVWEGLRPVDGRIPPEDHPQFRFARLLDGLGVSWAHVRNWHETQPPSPARNRVLSLSLRPAPVTDAWIGEGPELGDLVTAMQDVTLVEAETPRDEAQAIAARLRAAAETGLRAAVITPDRALTRQVAAALDQWRIVADDSAGEPLHLASAGRFLRQVAETLGRRMDAEMLLALLKHPLCHSGATPDQHGMFTQELDLAIRRVGLAYPDATALERLGHAITEHRTRQGSGMPAEFDGWIDWLCSTVCAEPLDGSRSTLGWMTALRSRAESVARGSLDADGTGRLWSGEDGEKAAATLVMMEQHAERGGDMDAADFEALLYLVLSGEEVRAPIGQHPGIMIWGTLEARVQGADLVILAGLNDGTWPEPTPPDQWLNRQMRHAAGLLLPERRIGLSAHDYQQAVAAPEVWITRSVRSDDAQTVPSRWVNRLCNLLDGLPEQKGREALDQMRARGSHWLRIARGLDTTMQVPASGRPSPRPPVGVRPRRFSVSEVDMLHRDPYAIYAKRILGLRPLNPLVPTADALLRGTVLHEVFEKFIASGDISASALIGVARDTLQRRVPWPAIREMWIARIAQLADWFVETEKARRERGSPIALEAGARGRLTLQEIATDITCRADRIDETPEGSVILYDYKTGQAPTPDAQLAHDRQLMIEAVILEGGGIADLGPRSVLAAEYIQLNTTPKVMPAPLSDKPVPDVRAEIVEVLGGYLDRNKGYTARRVPRFMKSFGGDYDHLARFGEWDDSSEPVGRPVGDAE